MMDGDYGFNKLYYVCLLLIDEHSTDKSSGCMLTVPTRPSLEVAQRLD